MKILMLLSTSSVTGPAELCLEDAKGLRQFGHEVIFGCDTRRPGNYQEKIAKAGFELMNDLTFCPKPTPKEIVLDLARLRKKLKDVDLVHCRFAHDHALTYLAMKGLSKRPALVRTAEIARSLRGGFFRRVSFKACDAIIVSCDEYANKLEKEHGLAKNKIHVLPGQVNAEQFCPGNGNGLRNELGIGEHELLFGVISRIKTERLHEQMVRGFARVALKMPLSKLVIIGRGEHEPAIRALVNQLNMENRVLFAGYRKAESLIEAYRALDAKIWLAEGNDGTCRAVLEAMACGKPVVVGNSGAMAQIVRNGVDGLVAEPTQFGVESALLELGDINKRKIMGISARQRAMEFSRVNRVEKLLNVYREVI